jgi:hypothetical protein
MSNTVAFKQLIYKGKGIETAHSWYYTMYILLHICYTVLYLCHSISMPILFRKHKVSVPLIECYAAAEQLLGCILHLFEDGLSSSLDPTYLANKAERGLGSFGITVTPDPWS